MVFIRAGFLLFLATPVGRADERKPVVLTAAQIAPAAIVSETPSATKWLLHRGVKCVPGEAMLLTGRGWDMFATGKFNDMAFRTDPNLYLVASKVPPLEVDPKLTGWYRIQVGMPAREDKTDGNYPPRLFGRLSHEPYSEYLRVSQNAGPGKFGLVDWRTADLTGKKLRFDPVPGPGRFPDRCWFGGISHLVFTPLTPAEIEAAKFDVALPPPDKRLFGIYDSTTEFNNWSKISGPDDVRASIYRHARAGFGRVYFRAWGSACDTSCAVPDAAPHWTEQDEKKFMEEFKCTGGWQYYIDLIRKHDFMKIAAEEGKARGLDVHAYIRLTNLNRAPYCEFWHKHPELRGSWPVLDKQTGKLIRMTPNSNLLSFAYPEVRTFYVQMCKQIVDAGARGLLLDLLRHPPICNFEAPVTDRLKERHGLDVWSLIKTKADVRHFLSRDPRGQAIQREFFEAFLKELRQAVGPTVEISVRSRNADGFALDGEKFVKAGLVDTILDSSYGAGVALPRPEIEKTLAAVGNKGRAFAVTEPFNVDPTTWTKKPGGLDAPGLLALAKLYHEKKVHGFGVYESASFIFDPDRCRAVRQASREFAGMRLGQAPR